MQIPVAQRLLNEMLEGGDLVEKDIRDLVGNGPDALNRETQYLEFKDGEKLQGKDAAETVRQYVSGFANADGGLLVFGVLDPDRDKEKPRYTGIPRSGGKAPDEWAGDVLQNMAGQLSPPPRIRRLSVDGEDVLVIAVARAPALVHVVERGQLKYYLRLAASTLEIPPYLISDLVLGRRQHPQLVLGPLPEGTFGPVNGSLVDFAFSLENQGLVSAEDTVVGVVAWALKLPGHKPITSTLRRYVDTPTPHQKGLELLHSVSAGARLRPFEKKSTGLNVASFAIAPSTSPIRMQSAVYVLSAGHPPDWYQLDWTLPAKGGDAIRGELTRKIGDPPIVAWDPS